MQRRPGKARKEFPDKRRGKSQLSNQLRRVESNRKTALKHEAVSIGGKKIERKNSFVSRRVLQIVAGQSNEVNPELELTDVCPCWPQRGWRPSAAVAQ